MIRELESTNTCTEDEDCTRPVECFVRGRHESRVLLEQWEDKKMERSLGLVRKGPRIEDSGSRIWPLTKERKKQIIQNYKDTVQRENHKPSSHPTTYTSVPKVHGMLRSIFHGSPMAIMGLIICSLASQSKLRQSGSYKIRCR
jgi:hypothetical protein